MARAGSVRDMGTMFGEEVALAARLGVGGAVRLTSRRLLARVDRRRLAETLARIRREGGPRGATPAEAFELYRRLADAYLSRRSPLLAWLARLARRLGVADPLRPALVAVDRVEWMVATGRRCPLLAACGCDVARAEPFCRAHARLGTLLQPEAVLLLRMLDPPMRFELARMRGAPDEPCTYAIVPGGQKEG